jgi:putative NADH-flavin reductase
MRIAIYGARGTIGSRIAAEALERGHHVTGISRSAVADAPEGAEWRSGDAHDAVFAAEVAEKHDVVVSAIGPSRTSDDGDRFRQSVRTLAETLGDRRLFVVGGAGSLEVDGQRLLDSPGFPEVYRSEALKSADVLADLRAAAPVVDWTYLSPAPVIEPGERTGQYRVGGHSPAGEHISAEDYAVAVLDEIERPAHVRERFTVAS